MNENMVNIIIGQLSLDVLKAEKKLSLILTSNTNDVDKSINDVKESLIALVMSETLLHKFTSFMDKSKTEK